MASMLEILETIKDGLATENAKLKEENELLKRAIDKAEKERTLCYACSKNIEELSIPKPHVPGATEALIEFYKKEKE